MASNASDGTPTAGNPTAPPQPPTTAEADLAAGGSAGGSAGRDETNPGETNPGETNPGETNHGDTNHGETDPGDTSPVETDPGGTDPGGLAGPLGAISADGGRRVRGPAMPAGRRPLIGITSYLERARFGVWELDSVLLPREYTDTVVRAGGIPVLLPPAGDGFAELVARLDGLLLAGGADVDPTRYGQETDPKTEGLRPDRDGFEFGLLTEALAQDLPILAVCRGMQVLNSALGGTLHQHLPDHVGHDGHRPVLGVFGTSRVGIAEGSRTAAAFGTDTKVHCHHHQAVDVVADSLTVAGTAEDGTVEAVEMSGDHFVIGVQWHPEQDPGDDRLVAALVREASRRAAR